MEENPFEPDPAWYAAQERIALVEALWGGTHAMRRGSERWLPKFPSEEDYESRKESAFVYPLYLEALRMHAGKVFSRPVEILSEAIKKLPYLPKMLANFDGAGTDHHTWLCRAFMTGEHHGLVHGFAEHPAMPAGAGSGSGERPFASMQTVPSVIGWRHEETGSGLQLTQARLVDSTEIPEGKYGKRILERCRVIERGKFQVFEREVDADTLLQRQASSSARGGTPLSARMRRLAGVPGTSVTDGPVETRSSFGVEIPWSTFYTNPIAPFEATPFMDPLAYQNLQHYQMESCVMTGAMYAIRPWYKFLGFTKEQVDEIEGLGFGMKVYHESVDRDVGAITQPTAAIQLGKDLLTMLEEHANTLSRNPLLIRRSGPETASGRTIDSLSAHADVQSLAVACNFFANSLIRWMVRWRGDDYDGDFVSVSREIGRADSNGFSIMLKALKEIATWPDELRTVAIEEMRAQNLILEKWETSRVLSALDKLESKLRENAKFQSAAEQVARRADAARTALDEGASIDEASAVRGGREDLGVD